MLDGLQEEWEYKKRFVCKNIAKANEPLFFLKDNVKCIQLNQRMLLSGNKINIYGKTFFKAQGKIGRG